MPTSSYPCVACGGKAEDHDLAPLSVQLYTVKPGAPALFDPSELAPWLRALTSLPNPRLELDGQCAGRLILLHPDLMAALLARETASGRVPEAAAARLLERVRADYAERIRAEAVALGIIKK